jgi:hypothetical protein
MEPIYDISNHNHRMGRSEDEGGVSDLDLVAGEEGMGGDEEEIMVK